MTLPFLTPQRSCKRCEHYYPSERPQYSGYCQIHSNATTDEWGEAYPDNSSSYPEVSYVWLTFGEDYAAKYCGEYHPVITAFTDDE